jgi:hypothetical protein
MVIKINGVNPRLVNSSVMSDELARLGLDPNGSIPTKISRLVSHIYTMICGEPTQIAFDEWATDNTNNQDVAICEPGCGGISLISKFEFCPFCGDSAVNTAPGDQVKKKLAVRRNLEILTQDDLDQNVNEINILKTRIAENYYELGVALRNNEEKCLWALRKKPSGEPKYKNFEAWVRSEVKLGRTQAMKCIAVVENFTEEDVKRIGHTKLAIALQVPQQYREALVERAEQGASKRELEKVVAEIKGKPKTDTITVALVLSDQFIPMMARPTSFDSEPEPACCIADEPWCSEELSNGVVQSFRVIENSDGNLVLQIRRCRPEGSE